MADVSFLAERNGAVPWHTAYQTDSDEEDVDPLPLMAEEDATAGPLIAPYLATERSVVVKVAAQLLYAAQLVGSSVLFSKRSFSQALELAAVGPSDRVLDLGSGDGRFCVAACQQFQAAAGAPYYGHCRYSTSPMLLYLSSQISYPHQAANFALTAVGIELDPSLVERSNIIAERCGVATSATFLAADFTEPGFEPARLCPGHPDKVLLMYSRTVLTRADYSMHPAFVGQNDEYLCLNKHR